MRGARLLLIDDSPEVTALVRALARRGGQSVTAAPSVAGAWEEIERGGVDLALLDVNLAGESGLELLRRRERAALRRPPVALFTLPELTEDVAAGWALGADFLVSKALLATPDRYQARLNEVLGRWHGLTGARLVKWDVGREQPQNRLAPSPWAAALVRATRHPIFRPLGPVLFDEVLRRALTCLFTRVLAPTGATAGEQIEGSLMSLRLSSADACRLCAGVVDQLWCLHGEGLSSAAEAVFAAEVIPLLMSPEAGQ